MRERERERVCECVVHRAKMGKQPIERERESEHTQSVPLSLSLSLSHTLSHAHTQTNVYLFWSTVTTSILTPSELYKSFGKYFIKCTRRTSVSDF